jgi:hypothetical protein
MTLICINILPFIFDNLCSMLCMSTNLVAHWGWLQSAAETRLKKKHLNQLCSKLEINFLCIRQLHREMLNIRLHLMIHILVCLPLSSQETLDLSNMATRTRQWQFLCTTLLQEWVTPKQFWYDTPTWLWDCWIINKWTECWVCDGLLFPSPSRIVKCFTKNI